MNQHPRALPAVESNPLHPAIASAVIGVSLLTLALVVFAGQARGIHGQCRDAGWYYVSAIFLPAAIFVSVLFTPVALYAGCLCRRRHLTSVRPAAILLALSGILLSIGSLGGLAYDLYSIRDLLW
jgi:hypothetical protein